MRKNRFALLFTTFVAVVLGFVGCQQEPQNELGAIEIVEQPYKTVYFVGEELDTTGLQIEAKYTFDSPKIVTGWTVRGFDSSVAMESQPVTVSYTEGGVTKTAEFRVKIVSKTLTKIEIVSQPTKKEYWVGEEFDATGFSVKAYYDDESNELVTGWTTDFDSSKVVTSKTVTVSYAGPGATKTTTFTVGIIGLKSISITKQPTKSEYYVGDELNTEGMEVTATYTNGTAEVVTGWTTSNFDSSKVATSKPVTVSYAGPGATKTTTFTVDIIALKSISITKQPTKSEYYVGDELDTEGMEVTATYTNGATEVVTGWTTDFDSSRDYPSKTVTVSYAGPGATKTATFWVQIVGLESISITKQPTNSEYYVGDKLDTKGMEVTARYTNYATKVVTDYTIEATGCTPNDEYDLITYTVSYTCGETKTATFSGKCKWHNTVEVLKDRTNGTLGRTGKYVLFGDFPQTIKKDDTVILSSWGPARTKTMGGKTYYLGSDGNWYSYIYEDADGTGEQYKYSNGTQVKTESQNSIKYFKVEPIKWRVLTDDYSGKSLLLAESILTANVYYFETGSTSVTDYHHNCYGNNYEHSRLRAYLNGISYNSYKAENDNAFKDKGFLQTAFTASARAKIAETTIDNSGESTTDAEKSRPWANGKESDGTTDSGYNDYTCANTKDKIFLLSMKEVTTTAYGFGSNDAKVRKPTDYAKANRANIPSSNGGGRWWLRSPFYKEAQSVCCVSGYGSTFASSTSMLSDDAYVLSRNIGVVPALAISLQ